MLHVNHGAKEAVIFIFFFALFSLFRGLRLGRFWLVRCCSFGLFLGGRLGEIVRCSL